MDVDLWVTMLYVGACYFSIYTPEPDISTFSERCAEARQILDTKTKPPGSLGQLEVVAARMAAWQRTRTPRVDPARVLVFAADHGVADDGVSAYPKEVTADMVRTIATGGAAVTVLARAADLPVEVLDVGVDADLSRLESTEHAAVRHAKVARGSANLRVRPALSADQCAAALDVGASAARAAHADGVRTLVLGELGIGNTTTAAALLCGLAGCAPEMAVGRGTGIDTAQHQHKVDVVAEALARHRAAPPGAILESLGGLEIAALVGAMDAGARLGLGLVVDGFIATVAALVALHRAESSAPIGHALFFAHEGSERGHATALAACGEAGALPLPLVALDLRLGEASGAVLAVPLLRSACALFDMASFEEANVATP